MSQEINDASHWRDFDQNLLSHSMAHYLMAIDTLRTEHGYARSTDVAEKLGVSRGAASMALSQLKKKDWVGEDHNRFLLLTETGAQIASQVEQNFLILNQFFKEVLNVGEEAAHADACKMEHLLGMETGKRLLWLMRFLMSDEELAIQVRKQMSKCNEGCSPVEVSECPICGSSGECLAALGTPSIEGTLP